MVNSSLVTDAVPVPALSIQDLAGLPMKKSLKFDLALFQYINEANRVMIATFPQLKSSAPISQFTNAQFFVKYNYARHFRLGHLLNRQTFWLSI